MALAAYSRNLYGPTKLVDLSVVVIVIVSGATPRDANRSSPDTTVVDATGGAYTCTMPSGQFQLALGAQPVNAGATTANITALSSTGGRTTFTVTISDTTALAAGEEIHVAFFVANQ